MPGTPSPSPPTNHDGVLTKADGYAWEKEEGHIWATADGSLTINLAQDTSADTGHPGAFAVLTIQGLTSLTAEDLLFN